VYLAILPEGPTVAPLHGEWDVRELVARPGRAHAAVGGERSTLRRLREASADIAPQPPSHAGVAGGSCRRSVSDGTDVDARHRTSVDKSGAGGNRTRASTGSRKSWSQCFRGGGLGRWELPRELPHSTCAEVTPRCGPRTAVDFDGRPWTRVRMRGREPVSMDVRRRPIAGRVCLVRSRCHGAPVQVPLLSWQR